MARAHAARVVPACEGSHSPPYHKGAAKVQTLHATEEANTIGSEEEDIRMHCNR